MRDKNQPRYRRRKPTPKLNTGANIRRNVVEDADRFIDRMLHNIRRYKGHQVPDETTEAKVLADTQVYKTSDNELRIALARAIMRLYAAEIESQLGRAE